MIIHRDIKTGSVTGFQRLPGKNSKVGFIAEGESICDVMSEIHDMAQAYADKNRLDFDQVITSMTLEGEVSDSVFGVHTA